MKRKIIKIDESKCNGCGLCAEACHEGAIGMAGGKARLLREDYCDGLGDCLPACPVGAITFEEREAPSYHQAAVSAAKERAASAAPGPGGGLIQWPVQIQLVPVNASYFDGAELLISADCAAYAYGGFHQRFMRGRVTLIGCPKLDGCDYSVKLTEILKQNDIQSVIVVRMEVPCCGGIEQAVRRAVQDSGKNLPWRVAVVTTDGRILSEALK